MYTCQLYFPLFIDDIFSCITVFILCSYGYYPVRIRVRIDLPRPVVCRMRWLNGLVFRMRPEKPRPCVTAGVCGTIKIPPCSKALSAEHRPKFCSPSMAMATSSYMWKILQRTVKLSSIIWILTCIYEGQGQTCHCGGIRVCSQLRETTLY
jgi:hypothetical protein